jgi:Domain of unknown function (DUF4262)/Domain of unknown function (DUF4265)
MAKVFFCLTQDQDGYPPVTEEALESRSLDLPNMYQIVGLPFYVKGISPGDTIEVQKDGKKLLFRRLVKASDNSVIRVIVFQQPDVDKIKAYLASVGCPFSIRSDRFLALKVPSTLPINQLLAFLQKGEDDELWEFEEGVIRSFSEQENITHHVEDFGWSVVKIKAELSLPGFAYTIGLYKSFNHPEVIVTALPSDTAHTLLNIIAEKVRSGFCFELGARYEDILHNYPVMFCKMGIQHYNEYCGLGNWYYSHKSYPVFQCLWPDKSFRFPGEAEFAFERQQLILCE